MRIYLAVRPYLLSIIRRITPSMIFGRIWFLAITSVAALILGFEVNRRLMLFLAIVIIADGIGDGMKESFELVDHYRRFMRRIRHG
jgi:Na+/citrate or Na+/malate symporter